jgi:signal transduction histidine kinase
LQQRDWRPFWREGARRAPVGLVLVPGVLGLAFFGLDLAHGGTFAWPALWVQLATTFLISWTIGLFMLAGLAVAFRLGMLGDGRARRSTQLALMGCLAMVGLAAGLVVAGVVLERCCDVPFHPDVGYFLGSLATGGLITAALIFRNAYRASQTRVEALERATAESRYETLKAQMQPHFLFNSLNSLSELIDAASPEAGATVGRLADLYRRILENSKTKTASLASEIAIIEDYLALERLRFGARLAYRIDCKVDATRVAVPSLILQTLVENAVKHGISPALAGGEVVVTATPRGDGWTTIEVANSGVGLAAQPRAAAGPRSTGTGLANARDRLALMYGDGAQLYFGAGAPGWTLARFSVSGEAHG